MIAILDAAYGDNRAAAACVVASSWQTGEAHREYFAMQDQASPYEPGQFYRRELPLLLSAIHEAKTSIDCAVVDGYVWLGPDSTPGLGAHLYEALVGRVPVIGVAKTRYLGTPAAEVLRGQSQRPLYVTAAGIGIDLAASHVRNMHGAGRIPTLIRRVDHLARSLLEQ
jgi:deoxyribonuclease V